MIMPASPGCYAQSGWRQCIHIVCHTFLHCLIRQFTHGGPNVIEQTIRQKLPKGFQRSEFLLEHGAIDMIVHRIDMRETIARLLSKLTGRTSLASSG